MVSPSPQLMGSLKIPSSAKKCRIVLGREKRPTSLEGDSQGDFLYEVTIVDIDAS